jgi:hypothetical protein
MFSQDIERIAECFPYLFQSIQHPHCR